MRAILSYGVALAIVLIIALWLTSGTLIQGGQGPGNGERPIIEVIEGDDKGPLGGLLEAIGLVKPAEEELPIGADNDAALTIAEKEAAANGGTAALPSVRFATISAESMAIEVPIRGRTQANARVTARAETGDIVTHVHVAKGDRVVPGQVLCTLEQGTRLTQVAQAEAAFARAEADLKTNTELRAKGVAAANTARPFEVALKAAQASLDQAKTELARTEISAEVAGTIQDPLASRGDMLSAGGACATIIELDPMLFAGKIAEARVALIREGMTALVQTVTGQSRQGTVRYVGASADEATRAFPVEIEMDNSDGALRDGVTADAIIRAGATMAHLLPQSALTLDAQGALGVRIVIEGDVVSFVPITILGDTTEGVWVSGLPRISDLIVVGQEYVTDGQKVAPRRAEEDNGQ